MKVNIETQLLCVDYSTIRGIPSYTINTLKALVKRAENDYSISFFDQFSERNNRKYMYEYIGEQCLKNVKMCECNRIRYSDFMPVGDLVWDKYGCNYNEAIGSNADVFHFPHFIILPTRIDGAVVVTIHDMLPVMSIAGNYFSNDYLKSTRPSYDASIQIIEKNPHYCICADSQATKNDILKFTKIKEEQVYVVPLAYDPLIHFLQKNIQLLSSIGINKPFLCFLGLINNRKGIDNLLTAFESIKPRYSDLQLVLAGYCDNPEILKKIANSKFKNDIICPGFVDNITKRALLSSAAAFLFPSEYEGFGLPVIEAMACGSPVITTNVSSLPEVGGDAVLYVEPKNSEQLAAQIERLLNSEDLRNEYIQKGFEQANKFSWDKTAEMTEKVYKIAYERRM
jgi:glycosyltransferase involved in cell wall biosynthesis